MTGIRSCNESNDEAAGIIRGKFFSIDAGRRLAHEKNFNADKKGDKYRCTPIMPVRLHRSRVRPDTPILYQRPSHLTDPNCCVSVITGLDPVIYSSTVLEEMAGSGDRP